MSTDFVKVLEMLQETGIRFVIIGGVAMRMHGSAHITDDFDVCYSRDPVGFAGLTSAFARHKVRLRNVPEDLPFFFDERTLKNTQNFTLTTDVGDVDLLAVPDGVESFEGLWERASVMEMFGMTVRVASLEDLIAMKRAANRPKDRLHLMELVDLQQFLLDESNRDKKN